MIAAWSYQPARKAVHQKSITRTGTAMGFSNLASFNHRSANVVVRLGCEPKTMTETTGCRSPKARLFDQAETKPRPSPPRPARDHNEIRPRPHRDYLRKVTETTDTAPYREGVISLAPRRLARLSTPRRLPFAALTLRFGCRTLCSQGRTPASHRSFDPAKPLLDRSPAPPPAIQPKRQNSHQPDSKVSRSAMEGSGKSLICPFAHECENLHAR
jgi:hypothetical protein